VVCLLYHWRQDLGSKVGYSYTKSKQMIAKSLTHHNINKVVTVTISEDANHLGEADIGPKWHTTCSLDL